MRIHTHMSCLFHASSSRLSPFSNRKTFVPFYDVSGSTYGMAPAVRRGTKMFRCVGRRIHVNIGVCIYILIFQAFGGGVASGDEDEDEDECDAYHLHVRFRCVCVCVCVPLQQPPACQLHLHATAVASGACRLQQHAATSCMSAACVCACTHVPHVYYGRYIL